MVQLMGSSAAADRPRAFVWLGPKDDPDLSEAVGQLLESSPHNFQVAYVGPKDITAESLKTVKLLAFPGGEDVDNLWKVVKPVAQPIRSFVAGGGRYLGFCLGAYMAGHSPGLGLLPNGSDVSAECDEEDAQVRDDRDTVIQIHWAFSSGSSAGKTVTDRWIYYQEGNYVKNFVEDNTSYVLGRYSKTDRVAATLNKYGEGWVGTIGPHPEADQSWFDLANITAPDGLQFEEPGGQAAGQWNGAESIYYSRDEFIHCIGAEAIYYDRAEFIHCIGAESIYYNRAGAIRYNGIKCIYYNRAKAI
ncbi:hypothetical protein NHJ13051_002231 [Beauveria bassiana]